MTSFLRVLPLAGALALAGCASLQQQRQPAPAIDPAAAQAARLNADLRALQEQVGQLQLEVEQLRRDNAQMRDAVDAARRAPADAATTAQLNQAVGQVRAEVAEVRTQVQRQNDALVRQVQGALDNLARQVNARAAQVSANTPAPDTEGIVYTVQAGDTLSTIARRFGVTVAQIQAANRMSGTTIRVGDNLFIPQGRN